MVRSASRLALSWIFVPYVAAAVLAGCATAAHEVAPSQLSCDEIATEIAATRAARTQAVAKRNDPWTFVIPFAVAGRHVAAASSVAEADRWLAELEAQARRNECRIPAHPRDPSVVA